MFTPTYKKNIKYDGLSEVILSLSHSRQKTKLDKFTSIYPGINLEYNSDSYQYLVQVIFQEFQLAYQISWATEVFW